MDNAHHVNSDRAVKSELLCDPRYFIGSQHYSKAKQHIAGEGQQPQKEESGLHKCGQTNSCHLFHLLIESVRISSRNRKHIKASDCDLYEQDASPFQISEEHFYHGIPHHHGTEYLQDRIPHSRHGG